MVGRVETVLNQEAVLMSAGAIATRLKTCHASVVKSLEYLSSAGRVEKFESSRGTLYKQK